MRVLCLHGKGTSGAIFRSQTSSFRARLADKNIEFDFVDGPFQSDPAAGVDLFYSPPYYAFWDSDSVDSVRAACAWLNDYIAKNGPYDAALMFSQGCVLGSSALLFHQEETPHLPPPFKSAIFICGGASLNVLVELGFHVSAEARERDAASRSALALQAGSSAVLTKGANRWTGLNSLDGGLSEEELRREITSPSRIQIPTVHIYGSKDPRYAAGVHLSGICDPENRRTYNHGGGHEVPRTDAVSRSIAELFQRALAQTTS
ncbi:Serine hydrolase FSH [Penicillium argentinense]|uniref:Serine hydrolase FSH n=1 Tax=Penicillium argentinense TaxID=1131581 RepID=A0A9W9ENN1_9EURO|nr:Serine hydrolase FSH [Penicillium argentinense]KAJ5085001.1 Serine hydrolase FSH [Penicillium argentinense]